MESQGVRDLRWVLESPSLLDGDNVVPSVKFEASDIDPNELHAFLNEHAGHRVGRYFENLILFWLTHIRRVDLIFHGHQIQEGTRTVGEVDFLFCDEQGRLNHCEAAVKFFLHYPREGTSDYPGPNARDNFEKKVAKLFDKQLRISEAYFPDVEIRQAFVRGMMFYHPSVGEPATSPDRLSPSHVRGLWIRSSELDLLDAFGGCHGAILNKPLWLSYPEETQCVAMDELLLQLDRHFTGSEFPVMVSLMESQTIEAARMFVVPDSWPETSLGKG